MDKPAPNGRGGHPAPATHDHPGAPWRRHAEALAAVERARVLDPLSAAVNLLVKAPLGEGVGRLAGIESGLGTATPLWFLLFLFALAPVFEELAKVEGGAVDLASLKKANLVPADSLRAKIVLSGSITSAVTVKGVGVTKGAKAAIEAAGGKVEAA